MSNNINFLSKPSFPLSSDTLAFMQGMIKFIENLTALGGSDYILSGCDVNGTSVSNGFIVVNNELLPFIGGTLSDTFIIAETKRDVTALGEIYPGVYTERVARFGSGSPQYNWADLKRIRDIGTTNDDFQHHIDDTENPHKVTKNQVGLGNLPNAKSDATNLDDSNTLATSKAVNDAIAAIRNTSMKLLGHVTVSADGKILNRLTGGYSTGIISNVSRIGTGVYRVKLAKPINCADYIVLPIAHWGYVGVEYFQYAMNGTYAFFQDITEFNVVTKNDDSADDMHFKIAIFEIPLNY